MEERNRTIWMRLGVSLRLTEDESEKIIKGDRDTLRKVILNGYYDLDGDSYIPLMDENGEDTGNTVDFIF